MTPALRVIIRFLGRKQLLVICASAIVGLHVIPVGGVTMALNEVPFLMPDPETVPDLQPGEPARIDQMEFATMRLDFFLHSAVFFPWVLLVWFYLNLSGSHSSRPPAKKILLWLVAGILLAAGTEAIQYLLPYRKYDHSDLAFNVLGVMLSFMLFLIRFPKRLGAMAPTTSAFALPSRS